MEKNIITLIAVVLIASACSGPLYKPKDLRTDKKYAKLLQQSTNEDSDSVFSINDSISLYYFSEGTGENILVVHGGPGYPFTAKWKGLDSLTDQYRFYYYHQRGCGKSTRPIEKFTGKNFYKNMCLLDETLGLPTQVADIEHIRRKMGQEKITLIGHSFGAFLATLYAIEFPEHIQSLVLVSPAEVVKMPSESGGLYEVVEQRLPSDVLEDYRKYLDRQFDYKNLFTKTENQLVKEQLEFFTYYNLAVNQPIVPAYQVENIGGWIQHACFLSMGKKHDYSKYLHEIRCPVLVIHGENDLMPAAACNQYLHNISQAEFEIIKDAAHFSFDEQPRKFGEIMKRFLAKQ